MTKAVLFLSLSMAFAACNTSKPKQNNAMLEKYPQCYHQNVKLSNKCIEKNEAGDATTALELENKAFPGQYN
jgi:hypothetical protein